MAFIAPDVLVTESNTGWVSFTITFLSVHLATAFFEFFFHRYVLHAPAVPFLAYFYTQHTRHHNLTRITFVRKNDTVINRFPIIEEEQHEASFFPSYSLLVFAALATGPFMLAHYFWPNVPIFSAGNCALAWSLVLYELLHALEHKPVENWEPLLAQPRLGRFWRIVYGFHLRHHADIQSNESISGFFGLPIPDLVFGTWVNPQTLYRHQAPGRKEEFASPQPVWFIRLLDRYAKMTIVKRRSQASA